MIQRKQTLFLFLSALLGLVLLFIPNHSLITPSGAVNVYLTPLQDPYVSTSLHYLAVVLNFITLLAAFVTIFLYRKRELQVKLCYVLMLFWFILTVIMGVGSFVVVQEPVIAVDTNYLAHATSIFGMIVCFFAARLIKKDIDLLKSADRIR